MTLKLIDGRKMEVKTVVLCPSKEKALITDKYDNMYEIRFEKIVSIKECE